MIKTFFICTAALAALSGCMMPVSNNQQPGEIPSARIHIKALTAPTAGENEIRLIRDPGVQWGANPIEFSINYVALVDILPGEAISAWLPAGTYTFTIKPNPNPQKLAPREITLTLQKGQKHTLRIGGNEFATIFEETGAR